jgi:hypothetical protein
VAADVEVIGADRLAATLRGVARRLPDVAPDAAGSLVAGRARSLAPKRSGRLAGSLRARRAQRDQLVVSGLVYAAVIHNGWPGHGISPNPFGRRALENSTGAVLTAYTADVRGLLGSVKGA